MAAGWSAPSEKSYYHRLLAHIRDEQGHDIIALNDLINIGGAIDQHKEHGITRAMWESQFGKIMRNPSYLMGYVLALETLGTLIAKPMHDRLMKTYPKNACRMMEVHSDVEPDHVVKAIEQVEMCPPEVRNEIMKSYDQTCDVYRYMLMAILEETAN